MRLPNNAPSGRDFAAASNRSNQSGFGNASGFKNAIHSQPSAALTAILLPAAKPALCCSRINCTCGNKSSASNSEASVLALSTTMIFSTGTDCFSTACKHLRRYGPEFQLTMIIAEDAMESAVFNLAVEISTKIIRLSVLRNAKTTRSLPFALKLILRARVVVWHTDVDKVFTGNECTEFQFSRMRH